MEQSIRLGRIAGIEIGVNWSILVIFWLVTWSLASEVFPSWFPNYATEAYWASGLVAAAFFFLSLLTHEMGHALLARHYGIKVEGITLWLFGGVAKLRGEAHTPAAEFRIAAVGPAISLGLAAFFAGVSLLIGKESLAAGIPLWLALMNAMLAMFNLVPAFPLDGGRVLRSFLWRRRGDKGSATRTAAAAGRIFGYLLIGVGILEWFLALSLGGLWFVFLGWFLLGAARAEESATLLSGAMKEVRVADVMTRNPLGVPDSITIEVLISDYIMRYRFSTFPVKSGSGSILGVITMSRVKQLPAESRPLTLVRDLMFPLNDVALTHSDEEAVILFRLIQESVAGRALVFDGPKLVGIVTPTDLAKAWEFAGFRTPSSKPFKSGSERLA